MVALVGVMALSVGLVLMADRAGAAPSTKAGSTPTHNWDENLAGTARFTVLSAFGGAAVRDNNTGLVWEQTTGIVPIIWGTATHYCVNKNVGGTVGWRLPSVVELKSLQDASPGAIAPFVPAVFTINPGNYWSATVNAGDPTRAWVVNFASGSVDSYDKTDPVYALNAWCVRGPMNADQY
jgi:hypothetical protein